MGESDKENVVTPPRWWESQPRPAYVGLERVESGQPWFEVYRVEPDVYVFYELGQFEEAISYLVLGEERGAVVDTGCGIGDVKALAEEFTSLPLMVVNTHSHYDHVAQNYMFDEVAMFDDPVARERAEKGGTHEEMIRLLGEGMVWRPLPEGFSPDEYHVPPFKVTRWLEDGDVVDLGGRKLEVLHTPGHSPDSICLLDQDARLFWTGDIFYTGAIYTYLPGGDLDLFIESYKRIIDLFRRYDKLMPSHNEPYIEKEILREVLKAAEEIRAGKGEYREGENGIRRYDYGRFALITAPP